MPGIHLAHVLLVVFAVVVISIICSGLGFMNLPYLPTTVGLKLELASGLVKDC